MDDVNDMMRIYNAQYYMRVLRDFSGKIPKCRFLFPKCSLQAS